MIRGIDAEEGFLYAIMLEGLIIALTSFHQLRKIRGIQKQKKSG